MTRWSGVGKVRNRLSTIGTSSAATNARHFGLREYSSCRSPGSENTAITGGMALSRDQAIEDARHVHLLDVVGAVEDVDDRIQRVRAGAAG